jgi:hypothetical protein
MEQSENKSLCTKHPRCISWADHPGECVVNSNQSPPVDDEQTDPNVATWPPLDDEGFPF